MTDRNRRRKTGNVLSLFATTAQEDIALLMASFHDSVRANDPYEAGRLSLAIEQALHRLGGDSALSPLNAGAFVGFKLLHDAMRLAPNRRGELLKALQLLDNVEKAEQN